MNTKSFLELININEKINNLKKETLLELGFTKDSDFDLISYSNNFWTIDGHHLIYLDKNNNVQAFRFDFILEKNEDEKMPIRYSENNLFYVSKQNHVFISELVLNENYYEIDNYPYNFNCFSIDKYCSIKELETEYYRKLTQNKICLYTAKMFEYMIEKNTTHQSLPPAISFTDYFKELDLRNRYKINNTIKNYSYVEFLKEYENHPFNADEYFYKQIRKVRPDESVYIDKIKDLSHEEKIKLHQEQQDEINNIEKETTEIKRKIQNKMIDVDKSKDLPF